MASETTRRALLGGAVIATAAMASPANGIMSPSRLEWSALVAAYERADAHMNKVGREHAQCQDAYVAGRELIGDKPQRPASRALPRDIAAMTVAELRSFTDGDEASPEQVRYRAELADWKAREAALDARTLGDIEGRWEAAVDAQAEAENRMLACPAPDAAALAYKMAVIERSYRGCDLDQTIMAHVFADARRLLGIGSTTDYEGVRS